MLDQKNQTLADFAVASGVRVPCASNQPLDLEDSQFVWFVERGAVDVFLVEKQNGEVQSALYRMTRIEEGGLVPGVAPQAGKTTLSLTAKGGPGTVLRRLPVVSLATVCSVELVALVDAWIMGIAATLSRSITYHPQPDAFVETGLPAQAEKGILSVRRGVAWLHLSSPDMALFMDLVETAEGNPGDRTNMIPVTPSSWVKLPVPQHISAVPSETLLNQGLLWRSLEDYHKLVFSLERINRSLDIVDLGNLDRASTTNRRLNEDIARRRLFNPYDLPEGKEDDRDGAMLGEVLRMVGRYQGFDFKWPAKSDIPDFTPTLTDVLDVSGVRGRRVRLALQDRWWVGNSGAMLAFRVDDGQPVALLPRMLRRYRMVDPATGHTTPVTARNAESLQTEAWSFYRPLTSGRAGLRDLFQIASKGLGANVARFTVAGLLGGLIMVLPAIVFGFIADRVIPSGEFVLLYLAITLLVAFAVIRALMHVFQGMVLMSLEGPITSRIEAAFWDRLLRLPSSFLHRYPTGDRAMRGMTFQRIRDAVQGVVTNDVLSILFLFPALTIIFLYDAVLGTVTAALGLLFLFMTVVLGLRQTAPCTKAMRIVQRRTGRLFQIINGIAKLRIEGAEGSAFATWARDYGEQLRAELELGARVAHLRALGTTLPLLAGAVLLLAATLYSSGTLTVGEFLAIYIAFMIFITGIIRLGSSFASLATIAPEYTQIRPFLAEIPETSTGGEPVEHLGGDIAFDRVSFRYDPEGPLILDNISIHARPGEFIAIAGESGAGKSTLFRLALGLNEPTSGTIYYDRRDLKKLNIKQLRRKIGAVPQEIQLHPQDLWDNIVGDKEDASAEAVWQAARTASVEDEIKAMPMGMLTCVGDNGSVTSGGESQRIMIARALMRRPRVLLLDEATNWLDNESQSKIMDNLAQLTSTRIVIAHRLSTLRQADRIYVLDGGKVTQEGTYAELTETEGVFRNLVRRQKA